jgi:hypothetical protein
LLRAIRDDLSELRAILDDIHDGMLVTQDDA